MPRLASLFSQEIYRNCCKQLARGRALAHEKCISTKTTQMPEFPEYKKTLFKLNIAETVPPDLDEFQGKGE